MTRLANGWTGIKQHFLSRIVLMVNEALPRAPAGLAQRDDAAVTKIGADADYFDLCLTAAKRVTLGRWKNS